MNHEHDHNDEFSSEGTVKRLQAENAELKKDNESLRSYRDQNQLVNMLRDAATRSSIRFHDSEDAVKLAIAVHKVHFKDGQLADGLGNAVNEYDLMRTIADGSPHLVRGGDSSNPSGAEQSPVPGRVKSDFKTARQKAEFIKKHGLDAWERLDLRRKN